MSYDETDDIIDKHRELVREAREAMVQNGAIDDSIARRPEFDGPRNNFCELCLMPADGGICPRCDLWGDGLYEENKWTYDEDVRNG